MQTTEVISDAYDLCGSLREADARRGGSGLRGGGGALRYLRAKRCADLSYLSPVVREVLDDTARECRGERLVQLSHDEDWKRARTRAGRTIEPLDIARVGGASAATLELLREELAWDARWCPGRS